MVQMTPSQNFVIHLIATLLMIVVTATIIDVYILRDGVQKLVKHINMAHHVKSKRTVDVLLCAEC